MNVVSVSEIKRRGMSAVDDQLVNGPVHIIRNNHPEYVVLSEQSYNSMIDDLVSVRLDASDLDIKEGRVKSGSVADLIGEIDSV